MNSVNITGRVTNDIELKTTQQGTSVCSFTVAVDRPAVKDKTDFIDCVAWRQKAEFLSKYFAKGDGIEITGVLTTRNYEDKNGNKRKAVEVVCDQVSFPKGKKKADGDNSQQDSVPVYSGYDSPNFEELGDDEELPF